MSKESSNVETSFTLLIIVALCLTFCGEPDLYDAWMYDVKVSECDKLKKEVSNE